jgi:hypothetical protein
MNDIQLYSRLKDLGMPATQAWPLTAQIRDTIHPIAAVAANKVLKAVAPQKSLKGLRPGSMLGSIALAQEGASVGGAVGGAVAGATAGSVVPVVGTAIGLVIGAIAGMLVHTGQGPQRAAQAQAIDQALAGLTTAYVGRTIPWMGTASAPGLQQFLQAIMTGGLFMSWDSSLVSSPSVNNNWAVTFIAAVKAVVNAIINNPAGATVTVPIVLSTGASGQGTKNFTFVNPGINAGPDAISQNIIMGPTGLMYWIITSIGETQAHASANATSAAAQKVFALMIDHATADAMPASLSTTLANAPIVQVPAPVVAAANTLAASTVASGTVPTLSASSGTTVAQVSAPTTLNTVNTDASGNPTVEPSTTVLPATSALTPTQDTTAALMQQMLSAQGANLTSPAATQLLADIAANGVAATPAGPSSLPDWLIPVGIAGAVLLAFLALKK